VTRRQFLALIVPLLAVLIGFIAITVLEKTGAVGSPPWDDGFARYVRTTLAYEFVGGVEDDRDAWEAYFEGLNAYVRHFDHYAEVVPPWRLTERRESSSGRYGGIGVRTQTPGRKPFEKVEIIGVKPGGPAHDAGIVVGDWIVAVEGRPVLEITTEGGSRLLAERIKGERGTMVSLRLLGPDGKQRDVEVKRARIDTSSVLGTRFVDEPGRIGYVRLDGFVMDTARAFKAALRGLLKRDLKGLVLDLRENRGGLLPGAVDVADALLDSGTIVQVRGRGDDFNDNIQAKRAATVSATIPVVVLINGGSASASEILAGALQDRRRAVLVGERSYGKFLVQTVEEVPMEQGLALFKRTSAIYLTPAGHNYQRSYRQKHDPLAGIPPDIEVVTSLKELDALRAIFDQELYADWNPESGPVETGFVDRALIAAIAVLKGETYYPLVPAKAG